MNKQSYTIDLLQPSSTVISEQSELQRVAGILNYPLVIRASKNQKNAITKVVHSPSELLQYLDP